MRVNLVDGTMFLTIVNGDEIRYNAKAIKVFADRFKNVEFKEEEKVCILLPFEDEMGDAERHLKRRLIENGITNLDRYVFFDSSETTEQNLFIDFLIYYWNKVSDYVCYGKPDGRYSGIPKEKILIFSELR